MLSGKKMQSYAVDFLKQMVAIYSPTGKEANLASFLLEQMQSLGFETRIDESGNVIGQFGKGPPTILLCGHMDTVTDELPIKIENNELFGRGAVDAKGPLAALIIAASKLRKENVPGQFIIAGVVDEEGKGDGIKQLIADNVKADYAIFGEPSGVGQITIAYKGSLHLKISVETTTGHSSAPWLFVNAIEKGFEMYNLLTRIQLPIKKKNSRFYSISHCLTKMKGGSSFSKVPARCVFHIDFRIPPKISSKQLLHEVHKNAQQFKQNNPNIHVKLETLDFCEPYEVDTNSIIVRSLSWAIRMIKDKPAVWVRKTGTGDMNLYGESTQTSIVTYGAGNSHFDHTINERINLNEYEESVQILCKGINRLLELHKKKQMRLFQVKHR
jgi:LysW-gamma-L-lysine carboxypeptidase